MPPPQSTVLTWQRRRRSGPEINSTLLIAPSLASMQTLSFAPVPRESRINYARKTADIGWVRMEQQPQRIYENMALLAFDLLARIIAMRIDTAPPFSALLTLWLSMMAAVGLTSRSPCSRHST